MWLNFEQYVPCMDPLDGRRAPLLPRTMRPFYQTRASEKEKMDQSYTLWQLLRHVFHVRRYRMIPRMTFGDTFLGSRTEEKRIAGSMDVPICQQSPAQIEIPYQCATNRTNVPELSFLRVDNPLAAEEHTNTPR